MPRILLDTFIVFILFFSCLAYGAVETMPLLIVEAVVVFMLFFHFAYMAYKGAISLVRAGIYLPLLLFLALIILQLIPLPLELISILPGNTAYLYKNFIPNEALRNYFTLSVFCPATSVELLKVLSYLGIFFLVINHIETRRQFSLLINAIIFLGFLISIFGIIQKFTYSGRVYWFDAPGTASQPFGPFVNRNHFAGCITMIIPLALGYSLSDIALSKRVVYGFCAAIMSLGLFLSLSRSGILVYLFSLCVFLSLLNLKNGLKIKKRLIFIWLLLVFGLFVSFGDAKAILERFTSLFNDSAASGLGHGYLWSDILKLWQDFPLFGIGLGAFRSISSMYKSINAQDLITYAHNDILQLLAETGLLGFMAIAVFFISYFRKVLGIWLKRRDTFAVSLTLAGLCSICAMLAFSWLDFNLHIPSNAILFFMIMGLTYRLAFTHFDHALPG